MENCSGSFTNDAHPPPQQKFFSILDIESGNFPPDSNTNKDDLNATVSVPTQRETRVEEIDRGTSSGYDPASFTVLNRDLMVESRPTGTPATAPQMNANVVRQPQSSQQSSFALPPTSLSSSTTAMERLAAEHREYINRLSNFDVFRLYGFLLKFKSMLNGKQLDYAELSAVLRGGDDALRRAVAVLLPHLLLVTETVFTPDSTALFNHPSVRNNNSLDAQRSIVPLNLTTGVADSMVVGGCRQCSQTFTNRVEMIGHFCAHYPDILYSVDWPMISNAGGVCQSAAASTTMLSTPVLTHVEDQLSTSYIQQISAPTSPTVAAPRQPLATDEERLLHGQLFSSIAIHQNQRRPPFNQSDSALVCSNIQEKHQVFNASNSGGAAVMESGCSRSIHPQHAQPFHQPRHNFRQHGLKNPQIHNFKANTTFAAPRREVVGMMSDQSYTPCIIVNGVPRLNDAYPSGPKMSSIFKRNTRNVRPKSSTAAETLEFTIGGVAERINDTIATTISNDSSQAAPEYHSTLEPAIAHQRLSQPIFVSKEQLMQTSLLLQRPQEQALFSAASSRPDAYETCAVCSATLATRDEYFQHLYVNHANHPAVFRTLMSENGTVISPTQGSSAQSAARHRGVKCSLCDERFPDAKVVEVHRLNAHTQMCTVCSTRLPTAFDLNLHMSVHTGHTYDCKDCGLCFPCRRTLAKHNSTHRVQDDDCNARDGNGNDGNDSSTSSLPKNADCDYSSLSALAEAAVAMGAQSAETWNSNEMLEKIERAIAAELDEGSPTTQLQQVFPPSAEKPSASVSSSPASLFAANPFYKELFRNTNAGAASNPLSANYQLQHARRRRLHNVGYSSPDKRLRLRDINAPETKSREGYDRIKESDKTSGGATTSMENEENVTAPSSLDNNNIFVEAGTNEPDLENQ